nr:hypothetical protein [Tanacetum cinerariifolium]
MAALLQSLKKLFYRVITGEIPLLDFEQWLYASPDVEPHLSADDYLALLTLNYRKSGARYELVKLLEQQLDLGEFETHKLLKLLQEACLKTPRLPFILMEFYDMYCRGYYFLQDLGLGYGLAVASPWVENTTADTWEELTSDQQAELLASFSPGLKHELDRVQRWLITGQITLTGEYDELGHHTYCDLRPSTNCG